MTFHVAFSAEAESNAREIRDWIAKQSPQGARTWLEAIENASARINKSADSFALAPEANAVGDELRQILFRTGSGNTYRALFVIRGQTAHVVAIRGAGQDLLQPSELDLPE